MTAKKTSASDDRELAVVQSSVIDEKTGEEVKKAPVHKRNGLYYIEVLGKDFRLSDELPLMAALKLSAMEDDDDMDLGSMYILIQCLIHEDDWKKFEKHAARAGVDEVTGLIAGAMESFGGRPTEGASGS